MLLNLFLCVSAEMTSGKDQIIQRSVSGLKMPARGVQLEPNVAMGTVCGSPPVPPEPSADIRRGLCHSCP